MGPAMETSGNAVQPKMKQPGSSEGEQATVSCILTTYTDFALTCGKENGRNHGEIQSSLGTLLSNLFRIQVFLDEIGKEANDGSSANGQEDEAVLSLGKVVQLRDETNGRK